jgi:hypothetical protein
MLVAQERRTGPRAPLTGTAVVHCRDVKVGCEILDVSAMGIGLLAPRELPDGEFVRVVFRLGAANDSRARGAAGGPERLHTVDGVVVSVTPSRVSGADGGVGVGCRLGIQFTVIEGHVAQQIHAYVTQQVGPAPRAGAIGAPPEHAARQTGEYAPKESYPDQPRAMRATGEFLAAMDDDDDQVAATGTDGEDTPRIPNRDGDAPIDRELLRLYLDAIRTVDAKRK